MSERRALIAGLGLIGGSIGIVLRRGGWRVAFLDPNVTLQDAQNTGAADVRVDDFDDADLIILATPVHVAIEQLRRLAAGGPAGRLPALLSVCSVMQPLRDVAAENFVAGHPLAGSHERGLAAARADLFAGARWFVDRDHPIIKEVIDACGATMEVVDAGEHDRAVALTSHLPQILSTALAAYLDEKQLERFAGSGLKTFLRLAGSDASVWQPVIEANRDNIGPHAEAVARLVREIVEGDSAEAFAKAQQVWKRLSSAPQ